MMERVPAKVRWTCDACNGSHDVPDVTVQVGQFQRMDPPIQRNWFTRQAWNADATKLHVQHFCSTICAGRAEPPP